MGAAVNTGWGSDLPLSTFRAFRTSCPHKMPSLPSLRVCQFCQVILPAQDGRGRCGRGRFFASLHAPSALDYFSHPRHFEDSIPLALHAGSDIAPKALGLFNQPVA